MKFHLGDVLSVSTPFLVSPTLIDGVYGILNFMTNDQLYTHQLPRAARECEPWLKRQFPQIADENGDDLQALLEGCANDDRAKICEDWLQTRIALYGEWLDVQPIPRDDHVFRNPLEELESMAPGRVVVISGGEAD